MNIRLKSAKKSKRFRYTQKQNDTQWSKHLQSWGRFQRILKKERPFILEVMWRSQWLVSTWWTRNADSLQNSTSLSETVRRIHLWGHVQWYMSVFKATLASFSVSVSCSSLITSTALSLIWVHSKHRLKGQCVILRFVMLNPPAKMTRVTAHKFFLACRWWIIVERIFSAVNFPLLGYR